MTIIIVLVVILVGMGTIIFDELFSFNDREVDTEFVDKETGDEFKTDTEKEEEPNSSNLESSSEDEIKLDLKDNEKEFSFDNSYGTVKISAVKALTPRGFSGSSNYIFYIKDNNLYLYTNEGEDELYVEDVVDIYYESAQSEEIVVKLSDNSKIIKESLYLKYVN